MARSKVVIIPARPDPSGRDRIRTSDPRYMEGQRLLVEAMRYLIQTDREGNREAAELISEHVRTKFRMSDSPLHTAEHPQPSPGSPLEVKLAQGRTARAPALLRPARHRRPTLSGSATSSKIRQPAQRQTGSTPSCSGPRMPLWSPETASAPPGRSAAAPDISILRRITHAPANAAARGRQGSTRPRAMAHRRVMRVLAESPEVGVQRHQLGARPQPHVQHPSGGQQKVVAHRVQPDVLHGQ